MTTLQKEVIGGLVRHGLTALAGGLAVLGITQDQQKQLIDFGMLGFGVAVWLGPVVWSLVRKWARAKSA